MCFSGHSLLTYMCIPDNYPVLGEFGLVRGKRAPSKLLVSGFFHGPKIIKHLTLRSWFSARFFEHITDSKIQARNIYGKTTTSCNI